jgi:hypothetical protein
MELFKFIYLDELVDWYQNNFKFNRLGDQTKLMFQKASGICSINHVSSHLKTRLKTKFKNYPELLKLIDTLKESDDQHIDFIDYIYKLDKVRNSSYTKTFSEFSALLF